MVGTVEQIIDNRLASSSWQKVDASLKYWRPFALAQGWPTITASGGPLRGGKLAGFVTMLVLTTIEALFLGPPLLARLLEETMLSM
eukprot:scaffold76276_cov71-Phaeocystis_antarctica.AAC.1